MCGITGIFNCKESINTSNFYKSHVLIKHRGPDDEGFVSLNGKEIKNFRGSDTTKHFNHLPHIQEVKESNLIIGHRRLSIIDLSYSGHQPFTYKNWVLAYNGEIYNYKELRKELQELGYNFETDTDTEVFLLSYFHFGNACFEKFIGMWAAALYNTETKELVLCRDFFGIKPLYYHIKNETIIFGSEIKFLISFFEELKVPDYKTIFDFVVHSQKDFSEHTFFEGVKQLTPGTVLTFSANGCSIDEIKIPTENSVNDFDVYQDVATSVNYHMIADVPVGITLSGGVDSSVIGCYLASNNENVESFSSVFPSYPEYDESKYIKETLKRYPQIKPNLVETNFENSWRAINEIIKCMDEPYRVIGMYQPYSICKLANEKGLKVLLGGQGADEIFSGYSAHFSELKKELTDSFRLFQLLELIYLKKLSIKEFLSLLKKKLFGGELECKEDNSKGYFRHEEMTEKFNSRTKYFNHGLREFLISEDRLNMHHSIEGRVPFLSLSLYKKYVGLPFSKLIKKDVSKVLLRNAFRGIVPDSILNRKDKMGYVSPDEIWLKAKKSEMLESIFNYEYFSNNFSKDEIQKLEMRSIWRFYIVTRWHDFIINAPKA